MPRNVIIELRYSPALAQAAARAEAAAGGRVEGDTTASTTETASVAESVASAAETIVEALPQIPSLSIDPTFPPVRVPSAETPGLTTAAADETADETEALAREELPEFTTYLVRGQVQDEDEEGLMQVATAAAPRRTRRSAQAEAQVVGVFADPQIAVCLICPGDPPLGTDADVARLLCVPRLHARRMDGSDVLVAIVDTGMNRAHLIAHGKVPNIDTARSWAPPGLPSPPTGGNWPVGHGTMCAFDALIAAPKCTLLDVAVLRSTRPGGSAMDGLLSDAVLAYRHLLNIMLAPRRPGERRSMVVNNSWGMFHPSWDFPPGNPGNYSDNPNHPFNRIVVSLDRAGADILFAAGNCGPNCPDGRCQGVTTKAIYGANSSPSVLSVGGVDITGLRVGYSSIGPGRLTARKPDVCGFTHFKGSGVYAADGGTSAATPVVAGLVAAIRSRRPYMPSSPASFPSQIRTLVRLTALDRGAPGYDLEYGFGIINGCRLSGLVTSADEGSFEGLLGELEATAPPSTDGRGLVGAPMPAVVYGMSEDRVLEAGPAAAAEASAGPDEWALEAASARPTEADAAPGERALEAGPARATEAEITSSR